MENDLMSLCRLCAEENKNGIIIFENDDVEPELCAIINKYLPLKIQRDENLPNSICPGCNIQLESSVQFLDLIAKGQLILRQLVKEQTKNVGNEDHFLVQVLEDGSLYAPAQPITLEMEGLTHPKRKRGRPKKIKAPTPPPEENPPEDPEISIEESILDTTAINESIEGRKRKRKTPQRFREAVQGKELDRIFKEEGVIDESDDDTEAVGKFEPQFNVKKDSEEWEEEVIGHMESSEGNALGQLVIVNKAKGRGRPKGKSRSIKQTCVLCMLEFSSLGRYMAHIASYHSKDDLAQFKSSNQESASTTEQESHKVDENFVASFNGDLYKSDGDINVAQIFEEKVSATIEVMEVKSIVSDDSLLMKPDGSLQMSENLPDNILAEEEPQVETEDLKAEKLPDSKFKCTKCNKLFLSKQSCEVHLKVAHLKARPYKCSVCEKSFPYQVTLKQHMLLHMTKGARGYACDQCGKVLSHPSSVIYHKEAEHNDGRRFVCIKCGKSFKHRQLLQRHQLVHSDYRPFACKVCNASFKTKANLLNHHPTHTGIKRFTCDVCQNQFANKASLKLHLRWHSGEKPYACKVCSKRFSQNGNLSEHMRIHTGEKPYQCNLCDRAFTTSSQHRLHLQRHRGEKPWKCSECEKRFSNKEAWRVHMRLHTGERPFSCDQCNRSFTERWALRKHQRIHSGERPYKCLVCNRSFADCSNLTKHKKIHFPEIGNIILPEYEIEKSSQSILPKLTEEELDDEGIVYVTYQANEDDDESETPTIRIIKYDCENGNNVFNQEASNSETYMINNVETMGGESEMIFDQVTDTEGHPLQFTTQDGTQLSITSTDGGKSLQVKTEDGQLIPVQLSEKLDDEENILKEPLILSSAIVDEEASTSENTIQVMGPGGQTLKFLATVDENNYSYYTFS